MIDYGYAHRAELLLDTPEHRDVLKIKRAIDWLGEKWLCHPSQRHTREAHRAHASGPHSFRSVQGIRRINPDASP